MIRKILVKDLERMGFLFDILRIDAFLENLDCTGTTCDKCPYGPYYNGCGRVRIKQVLSLCQGSKYYDRSEDTGSGRR